MSYSTTISVFVGAVIPQTWLRRRCRHPDFTDPLCPVCGKPPRERTYSVTSPEATAAFGLADDEDALDNALSNGMKIPGTGLEILTYRHASVGELVLVGRPLVPSWDPDDAEFDKLTPWSLARAAAPSFAEIPALPCMAGCPLDPETYGLHTITGRW